MASLSAGSGEKFNSDNRLIGSSQRRYKQMIRIATTSDIPAIKAIADPLRDQISFVRTGALQRGIDKRELYVAELDNQIVGFINWHGSRDGWSTVYELAVSPDFRGQGVGRNLLYAVPCPVSLKCTVENPANEFYQKAGMRKIATLKGKRRQVNLYEMNVLNVVVRGNCKRTPDICRVAGSAYGIQEHQTAYAPVFMLDVEFEAPNWTTYLETVKALQPVQALVVDYADPANKAEMLQQVQDLRDSGVLRTVVCVKFHGAALDIPRDCIIGVSLRTNGKLANGHNKFAGFMPHFGELTGRRCHLLGGSPQLQKDTIAKLHGYGATVISVDGNAQFGAAGKGSVYGENTWNRRRGDKVEYYAAAQQSTQAIQRELNAVEMKQLPLI